jgi:uncharacterized protein
MVLHGHTNRPAGAGAAVFHHSQARGRQAFSGDAGREGRHSFLAVEMRKETDGASNLLRFRTNVDDWVRCDAEHRLRFEAAADGGLTPYLHVRSDLWAKVTRALYYDLVDMGEERMIDGREMFGVASAGEFFPMADAGEVRAAL